MVTLGALVTLEAWSAGPKLKCRGCGRVSESCQKHDRGSYPFAGAIHPTETYSTRWRCDHCGSYRTSEDVVVFK